MSSEHVGVTRYVVAAAALATSAACVYKLQSRSRSCHAAASQSCNNETRRRRRDLQDSQEAVRCHRRRRRSDADESGEAPKGFLASLLPWCWATCRTGNGAVDKSSHYCCVCSNANDEDEEPEANGFGANTGAPSDDIVAVLQQLQDGPFGFGGANVKVLSSKKREERRRRRRGRRPHMRGKSSPPTTALPTRSSGRGQESRQQRQSRHASATLLANRGSPASEALLGSPTSMLLEPHSSSPTISLTESPTTPTSATLSDSCYDSSTDAGTDDRDSITSSLCASLDGGQRPSCSASPAGSVPTTQDNSPPTALAHTRTAQYLPPQATHHTPARTYPPMGSDNSGRNGSYAHHHPHHVNGGYNSNANMPIHNVGTDGASVDEEEERLEAFARWAGSSTVSSAVAARFILRPQQQQQPTTATASSVGRESYIPLSTLASGTAGGTGYVGNAAAAWAINSFASRGGGGGFGDGHSGDTGKKRSAWSRVHRALRPLRRVVRNATRRCLWCAAFLWSVPFAATVSVVRSLMSWLRQSFYDEVVNRAEEAADPAMHDGDGSSNNNDNDDEQGGLDERLNAFTSAILERLQHDTDLHKQIDELLEPLQPTPGRVPSVAIVRAPLLHDTSADVRSLWKAIKQDPTVSEDDLVDVVVMSTVDPSSPEAAIARDGRGGAGRAVAGGGGGGVSWNPFTSPLSHDNMSSFGPSPSGMSGGGGMSPVFLPSGLSGGTFGQTARDVADDGGGGSVAPSKNRSTSSEERKPLSSISTTTDQSSHDGGSDKEDGRGGGSGGSSPYSAVRSVEVRNEISFQIVPAYTYYAYLARCCVLQEKDNVIFTRLPSLLHHIERCARKRAGLSSDRFSHSTNLNVTLPFPSPLVAPAAATAAEAPRASPPPPPLVREAVRVHGVGVPAVLAPRATSTDALPNAAALPPSLISSTPRGGGSGVSLNTMTTVSGDAHSSSSATNLDVDTFLSVWQGGRNEPFLMSAPSAACQPSELPTKSTNPSSSSMRDLWKQFSSSVAKTLRSPTSMLASPLGRSVPVVVPPQSFAYAAAVVNDEEDDNEGSTPEVVPLCMTPSSPGAAARVGSVGGGGGGVAASSMKQRAATAAGEGEQGAGARQIVLTVRSLDYLSTGGLGTSKHTTHFDLSPPTPSPGLYNRGSNGARYRHRRLHSHHSHRTPHAAPQQHLGLQSPETGANDSIDVSIDSARQGGEATTNSHNGDPMEPFGPLPVRDHTAVLPTDITDGTGRTRAIAGTGGGGSMPVYTPDASPHPFRRLQPGSDAALDGEQHQQAMALSQHDSSHYRHSTVSTLSPKQLSALALSPPLGASVSVTTATSGATRTPPARAVSGKNASVLSVLASPFANFFQQPQAQQQQQQQHRQQQHLPLRSASDIQRQRFSISLLKLTGRSQRMLDDMEALLKRVREHWQTALTELRQETLKVLVSTERIGHLDGEALQAELLLRAERVLRESVLPLFTLGMARREEMREGLMEELEDTSFTVCAIPLPDQRVYRNVPPAVPRHIAAHARGFPLEHTFAEEILHQQRVLQGILIALEEHQHRKYVRRERRRVLRQQAKAARRTKRSSRLLPPPLRHAWQSIRRFARSSDARGGSEHHMGNGSGDGLLGSPTAEEGGLATATATVAAEDCLCGAGKVCLKCEVAGTRHRAGGYRRHQNLFPVLQPSPAAADTTPTATPVHESVSNGSGGGVATRGPSMGVAVPQAFQGRGTTTTTTTLHASTPPRIQVPTLSTPVSDPTLKYTTFPPEGLETPPLSDPADFAGGSAATIGHNGCDDSNGNSDTSHALWGGGGGRASPESRWEQQQQQQPTLSRQPPPGEALRSGSGGLGRGLRSVRSSSMGLVNLADAPLPSYGGATTGSGTGTLAAAAPSLDPAKRAGTPRSGATTADTSTVVGLTPPLASLPGADSDQVPSSSSNHHHHHGNGENSAAVEEARQQRGYWVETITATNLARGGDLSGGANGTSPGSATVASSSSSPSGGGMHSPLPGIGGRTPPVLGLSVPTMGLGAGGGGGLCDSASLSAPLAAAPYNALASGFSPSSRTDQSEAASARSVHRPTRSHDSQCTDAATTNHQTDTSTGLGGTSEVSYRPPVPNNSMYGTYDAYYGHTVAAPQAVLLRQQALMEVSEANRRARAKQEKRRRRSTAITTAGAGGGGGGGGTLTPFAADFAHPHPSSADRHHQQQQQQTTEAARHRYSRPMEEPPLTHYERVRRTTSLDSLGATGAVPGVGATSPSPAAHRHSAASSLTSIPVTLAATQLPASRYPHTQQDDDDPQQHPHHSEEDMNATQSPLLRYSHNLFDLLGTGGGPMYSGITYYYTFGDSAAGLFNSSIQPRPELTEAWETFNEEEAVGDAPGDAGERRCGAAFRVTGSAPASTSTSIVSPTSGKPGKPGSAPPVEDYLPVAKPLSSRSGGADAAAAGSAARGTDGDDDSEAARGKEEGEAVDEGCSYFYEADAEDDEEARELQRQDAAREERNRHFYSLFRHLHRVYYDTVLRVPPPPPSLTRRSVSATMGRTGSPTSTTTTTTTTADGRVGIATLPPLFPSAPSPPPARQGGAPSLGSSPGSSAGFPRPVSPQSPGHRRTNTSSSPRGGGSSGDGHRRGLFRRLVGLVMSSSGAALGSSMFPSGVIGEGDAAAQGGSGGQQTATTTKRDCVTFAARTRRRSELNVANGNYGLTPLEVWLACRYSRKAAAEVYVMDINAQKGDPYFPAVRVVDEVVAHAVLYYHNRSLRDFLEELGTQFGLYYEPRTLWGRIRLGYPVTSSSSSSASSSSSSTSGSSPGSVSPQPHPASSRPPRPANGAVGSCHASPLSISDGAAAQRGGVDITQPPTTSPRGEEEEGKEGGLDGTGMRSRAVPSPSTGSSSPLVAMLPTNSPAVSEGGAQHKGSAGTRRQNESALVGGDSGSSSSDEDDSSHTTHPSPSQQQPQGSHQRSRAEAARGARHKKRAAFTVQGGKDKLFKSGDETLDMTMYYMYVVDEQEDGILFLSVENCLTSDATKRLPTTMTREEEREERMLMHELRYLKEFLLENRNVLSSASLTPTGSNRLEGVFGAPSTVFPFLQCARESVGYVQTIHNSLQRHYGLLSFEGFAKYASDVFSRDHPEIIRHAPRIFRTLNRSRRGHITYDELCSWMGRKLSCGSNLKPDAHLLATTTSLRLPLTFLLDSKEEWTSTRECALHSLSDGDGDF